MSKRVDRKQAARVVREQLAKERRRTRTMWISFGAIVALVLAGVIGWSIYQSQKPASYAMPAGATDNGGISVAGEGPVTVEVYLDFLCPACKAFETNATPALDQMVAEKKIRLVWHTLGFLDRASSPAGYSTRAASSAGCASDAGKLKAYGEALFAHQPPEGGPGLSDDELIGISGTVGIIAPSFAQCVRAVKYRDWVAHVNDLAAERGVNQTPTVYVAGKKIDEPSVENIRAAVDAAGR